MKGERCRCTYLVDIFFTETESEIKSSLFESSIKLFFSLTMEQSVLEQVELLDAVTIITIIVRILFLVLVMRLV